MIKTCSRELTSRSSHIDVLGICDSLCEIHFCSPVSIDENSDDCDFPHQPSVWGRGLELRERSRGVCWEYMFQIPTNSLISADLVSVDMMGLKDGLFSLRPLTNTTFPGSSKLFSLPQLILSSKFLLDLDGKSTLREHQWNSSSECKKHRTQCDQFIKDDGRGEMQQSISTATLKTFHESTVCNLDGSAHIYVPAVNKHGLSECFRHAAGYEWLHRPSK